MRHYAPRMAAETNTSQRRSTILQRLAHDIRYASDLGPVLEAAVDSALQLVDAAIGALSYADMSTQRYVLAASRGLSQAYVAGVTTWSLHEGLAGQAFGLRETLTVTDLGASREVPRPVVRTERLRGYACVPLLRGQRRLGIIEVFDKEPRAFTVEEVESLELVAAFISSLVESLVTADELRFLRDERAKVLRQWTTQALTAADTQRRDVVRALQAEADSLMKVDRMTGLEAGERLRRLADDIAGADLEWVDMVPLVREAIADRWRTQSGAPVMLDLGQWPATLPLELTTRLYLLMHGLVESATRAAESSVRLHLGGDDDAMWVEVTDDRLRAPGGDPVLEIAPDIATTIRGMEGTVLAVNRPSDEAGVRVVLPLSLSRPEVGKLTARERKVLEGLTFGTPNRAIAADLGISPKTLQNHLTAIYRKLGVTSRAQAVKFL